MVDVTEKERADKALTLIIAAMFFVHNNHRNHSPASSIIEAEQFVKEANERGYGLADIFGEGTKA